MNKYDEKAAKMRQHLAEHPHDYQTVISLFKAESDSVVWEQMQKYNQGMAEIAKYRRESNAEQTQ